MERGEGGGNRSTLSIFIHNVQHQVCMQGTFVIAQIGTL